MRNLIFILVFLFGGISFQSAAQIAKDTPKIKPPKMEAFWGDVRGGNIIADKVIELTDKNLIVIADKKESLKISRAIFVYRSKDMFEDEETGKVKTVFNTTSYEFRNTDTLPEKWRNFLKENAKAGDQIVIADIIVRDKKNNLFKAGDIKIFIE